MAARIDPDIIPVHLLESCDTLFLDRDGVINVWLPGDYVKTRSEFVFIDGVLDAIAVWSRHFKHIFIVTNQRGVGKGIMSLAALDDIHSMMLDAIAAAGGRIDRIYLCTATDDSDPMRKPNPGMSLQAMRDFPDVRMERSVMIGDQDSDRKFAENCGMAFVRVL